MKEYIERDAALQDMWNALYALEDQREKHHGLDLFERKNLQDGFEAGQGVIANRPAADVVEVKHRQWIYSKVGGWKCSECNNQAPFWWMASTQNLSDYCPNCGAKMDGGVNDEQ